ncbi:hypothetical protein [Dongia rigui]|uniref:Uncharacterized protein n=1 Tax=Dongia rigui TaxID=940149 RepID=A0ABU5DYT7_9PROT|nr:hypothetical protein [Dongia rigui]MDY0872182.1 hypothetical protein [Dongia rigui]
MGQAPNLPAEDDEQGEEVARIERWSCAFDRDLACDQWQCVCPITYLEQIMPSRHLLAAIGAVALISACTQVATPGTTGKKSGTIACDGFVKPGSALALELQDFKDAPKCSRAFHPGGQGYYEAYSLAARDRVNPAASGPQQIWVLLFRFYGGTARDAQRLDEKSFDHIENFRTLSGGLKSDLPGLIGDVPAVTFDVAEAGLTMVCLDALTANKDGSHTVVDICRSTSTATADAERLTMAQAIAQNDLPSTTP